MKVADGLWEGDPEEFPAALAQIDTQASAVAAALIQWEDGWQEEHGDEGWDMPPLFAALVRHILPEELNEALTQFLNEVRGGPRNRAMGMMLQMIPLDLPDDVNTDQGPHIAQIIEVLAEHIGKDSGPFRDAINRDRAEGRDEELLAWMVIVEAWMVEESDVNQDTLWSDLTPANRPDRVEVRVVSAVDRAGYTYQLSRKRKNGERLMVLDMHQTDDPMHGMQGRIPAALAALMDATPEIL